MARNTAAARRAQRKAEIIRAGSVRSIQALDAANKQGADIATAAALPLATATGAVVAATGSVTVTSIPEAPAGTIREVIYEDSPIITHNDVSLILPTKNDIQAKPGDTAIYRSLGGGNWKCMSHTRADGSPVIPMMQYHGTSTTSLLVALGSKAFTTQEGLSYTEGVRIRAASDSASAAFMEGPVVSYESGVLTLDVDRIGSVTTKADWTLNLAVDDDSISNDALRNSAACSVIGRAANSSGNPGDIILVEGTILCRSVNQIIGLFPSGFPSATPDAGDSVIFGDFSDGAKTKSSLLSALLPALDLEVGTDFYSIAATDAAIAASTSVSPNSLSGFRLLWSSTSVVLVGPIVGTAGACADKTNAVQITLASRSTVTVTTNAAISGNDSFTGAGTCSVTTGLSAVVGSGTAFLTAFAPGGVPRVGAGTITTTGTAVAGTSTAFLTELAVGDLIGTSAAYSQITAIASDTAATALASLALTGAAYKIIENPTIKIDTNTVEQVTAIATDTALTIATGASATKVSTAYTIGNCPADGSMPIANQTFMFVWVGTGGSGTGCYASTQRTTPFGITGYTTSVRRIGAVLISAGLIVEFDQTGEGRQKTYTYENAKIGNSTRVLTSGAANATWTAVICAGVVPPTASNLNLVVTVTTTLGRLMYLRKRNSGSATVSRNTFVICTTVGGSNILVPKFPCDGAQAIDYSHDGASGVGFIDVIGYSEEL